MYPVDLIYNVGEKNIEYLSALNKRLNELADKYDPVYTQYTNPPFITTRNGITQVKLTYVFSTETEANEFIREVRELPMKFGITKNW